MFTKFISLAAFLLLVTTLAGCIPVLTRVSSADAGTPIVHGYVDPTLPASTPTARPASVTLPLPIPTRAQAVNLPAAIWKTFNSPAYHYVISYPPDWTVSVENPGSMGDAIQIETVIFKQPEYGNPNQFSSVTIQAAQHAYGTTGECLNQSEVIPGIIGCRRGFPKAQNPAQELIWFQPPLALADAQPYFVVQFVYDDVRYVGTFERMLTAFKYTGVPVTVTPQDDGSCRYKAVFLGDVTIPDNTVIAPGASFVKTWRLRNESTCPWGYAGFPLHRLVFVGGDRLGAPNFIELPVPLLGQGGTIDISVPMVTPPSPGTYQSNWRLQVDTGQQVGVGPNGDTPLYARIVVPGPATPTAMPPPAWKTYTSAKHHYVVNYPADWTMNVQTSALGRDPEYVYLSPSGAGLPQVQILALKDQPPILGFENCNKNLLFRGVQACSLSLPKAQIPATKLLIFQKGESYYHLAAEYEVQQQLGVFDEIVRSFQFTP